MTSMMVPPNIKDRNGNKRNSFSLFCVILGIWCVLLGLFTIVFLYMFYISRCNVTVNLVVYILY